MNPKQHDLAADATLASADARTSEKRERVAIVGGGLAGLAAGCALADEGYTVTLFERRPYLGGRASSYEHPGTGETVDNCQHVLLGCCTNLLDLYRRLGVEDQITWFTQLNFIEPGGRTSVLKPSFLPAPFHSTLSFLKAKFLDIADKDAISRGLMRLMPGLPEENGESFLDWLKRTGQTERAIRRFWEPVIVSALNEDLDRASLKYAAQVFRESFLKSAEAGRMGVPRVPLSQLYGVAADYIRARGGEVKLRASVESFAPGQGEVRLTVSGQAQRFDYAVFAVPFDVLQKMLPAENGLAPLRAQLERFEFSPITGVHFWFDRAVTDLPHAVLLDRTIQWMFNKSSIQSSVSSLQRNKESDVSNQTASGQYIELVISSSKKLVETGKQEILYMALAELAEFFPKVREAKLLKSTVIKEIKATYSASPKSDDFRPPTQTPYPRLFLAGDWTQTGWPATMEGAVRSGYIAADAILRGASPVRKPDLGPAGLMRLFG